MTFFELSIYFFIILGISLIVMPVKTKTYSYTKLYEGYLVKTNYERKESIFIGLCCLAGAFGIWLVINM